MADTNDRDQGFDNDLFDESAPRSIFAATWFRAVLVLIVLGVIGAVAVPYILDAMNAPKSGTTAKLPTPPPPSKPAAPPAPVAVTPPPLPSAPPAAGTPPTPPTAATPTPPPAPPGPVAATPAPTPPSPPSTLTDKPSDTKDAMVAATTPAEAPKAEPKTKPAAAKTVTKTAKPAAGGQWFVQIGAFKDAGTAKTVAAKLREEKYTVEESLRNGSAATVAKATMSSAPPSSGGGDHYDVIVIGQSSAELNKRLSAKGLSAEPVANGAVVKPSLPLRDAVALSKDLAVDGLKVQVRRAGDSATSAPKASSATTASAAGDSLHRVSVGGFPDRATAMTALKELEAKGYKPFLTRR
jgi:cell division septation protein DedD